MAAGRWVFVRITPRVVLIALYSFDRQRISTPTGIPTRSDRHRLRFRIGSTRLILNIRWTRAIFRVLAPAHDPGSGQPGAPPSSGSRAGRPRPKHGALLRPVGRADSLRGFRPRTPLGTHRRRRAGADRLAPLSASRPGRTGEVAQPQEAPRLRAPGMTVELRSS